ncbi:MAG: TolC family protein [Bacteroidia bacterium]
MIPIFSLAQADSLPKLKLPPDMAAQVVNGSYNVDTIFFDLSKDLSEQLLPLDSLINIAIKNSPSMMFEDATIERNKQHMRYNRYTFLNGVSGFYNYTQGDQISLVQNAGADPALSNAFGIGTRYGFNITLPLSEVVARPYRMKQLKQEITMAKHKKNEMAIEVKRQVISDYFNMIAAQRILNIRIQDAESARLTVEIAQVEMKRGKIHPQELSRLKNLHAIAEANLEMSKKEFMIFFYQLETMLGERLHNLKRTK